jgi:hypothetical protein
MSDPLLSRFDAFPPQPTAAPGFAGRPLPLPVQQILAPTTRARRKIWEFDATLHCSIIGTCLSNAELRQILLKLSFKEAATATEHELHSSGVLIAGKHTESAKLLHKALDRRHRVAINRFARAKSAAGVRSLWQEAVQGGEIPGAYWAALTHPATNDVLVREVFAEVHMLSHLVGAANRAYIRRLRQLEADNADLLAKVERQQRQLRDAIVARDTTIRELSRALEARIDRGPDRTEAPSEAAWAALAADLKCRLDRCTSRSERLERQLTQARSALAAECLARSASEEREVELRREVEAIETSLAMAGEVADEIRAEVPGGAAADANAPLPIGPLGATLLYVGGRPAQIGHLRAWAERCGANFLHHDGGIEERGGLLPGLVSRADAVLFPVDCVSHAAMSVVKRLCRQAGKPFLPLRSAGLAPFCAALRNPVLNAAPD